MTPTWSTISVDEVLVNAKAKLRIGDSSQDDFLTLLFFEALSSLNAYSQLKKENCPLTFQGSTAKLPDNYVRYLALRLDTASDTTNDPIQNQIFNGCQYYLYADLNYLNNCGCDTTGALDWNRGGFQISNGFIHLNSEVEVISATLAYMGLNVDANGKRVIFERYERGVSAYLCWKYALTWFEQFNQYVIDSYQQEWMAQRGKLIGIDNAQSFQQEKRQIQNIWGAMLVSPIVNFNIGP